MFQNLGDGTYFHSGSLAIRQAIAAKVNITYKILYNDAVAMTGGQPVDGTLTVPDIAHQVRSEGVQTIIVMSDDIAKWSKPEMFPVGVEFIHRDELDAVQKRMREVPGVSVLIYDQTCATEKRRRRKRGKMDDPNKRIFINSLVCEGCGDCGEKSFCVSVLPKETEYGRKREIDQSSCNKDYSCVKGFCPSFVTVHGGGAEEAQGRRGDSRFLALPHAGVRDRSRAAVEHPRHRHRRHRRRHDRRADRHGRASRRQGRDRARPDRPRAEGRRGDVPPAHRAARRTKSTRCASPRAKPISCSAATWSSSTTTGRCRRSAPAARTSC